MKRNVWIAALCCALMVVAGCGDDVVPTDDGGPTDGGRDSSTSDGGGECEGLTLCTTIGTSCDGDELVTCATNADGCRVETRDDCAAADQVCNVTGDTASCIDPCLLIPTEMRCDAAGRSCDGATLEICTANADGCFVLETTDCAAMPDGACGMGDTMLECLLPADPCAAIPAAERCTVEGTSCTGDELVTCAPNAFGCLVTTTTDCTTRTGGLCDDTTDPTAAICVATDACAGITQCAAAYTECVGPTLVSCSADAFGCLVETTEDCTAAPFGFCDADATPSDMCSTAAIDPCMGVTECGTEPSRSCSDRMTLSVCAANAFGCYVTEDTNCAATTGEVCDDTGTMPICVDACSLVDVCPAASYCDGTDIVSCTANADGCLVEATRTPCAAGELCDATGAAPVCATDTICPEAGARVIDCASGTVSGDTAMGSDVGTGAGDCATSGYEGNEQYWRFRHNGTGPVEVQISSSRGAATGDYDLFVLDGGDGTATCTTATLACLDESTNLNGDEDVVFAADPGDLAYVIYDNWTDNTSTTAYTLTVTCIDVVCGNGTVEGAETCDDGNTTAGDGCSATCAFDTGYECTGEPSVCTLSCGDGDLDTGEECDDGGRVDGNGCSATCTVETGYRCAGEPSVCLAAAPNAVCSGATALAGTTTLTGENLAAGGTAPTAAGCGPSAGPVRYYAVAVPANSRVDIVADSTGQSWDLTLRTLDACDAACTAHIDEWDTLDEELTLQNPTATARTVYVAVGSFAADDFDTYDLDITTTTLAANASCAGAIPMGASVMGDVSTGGAPPSGASCGSSPGPVVYYTVDVPANSVVTLTADPATSWDVTLRTLADCTGACINHQDAVSSGTDEVLRVYNTTGATLSRVIAVGADSTSTFGAFTLTASAPVALASNAVCSAGRVVTADTSFTGESFAGGGPRPQGTSCGTGAGDSALYYTVTVPALTQVAVSTTSTANRVLLVQESCGATSCSFRTDTSPEGTTIANSGATPITRIVAIHTSASTTTGTFDVAFAYSPVPYTTAPITAACVTTGTWTSLTRSSATGNDATTPITALPFGFSYFGAAVTHYSTNTNGIAQLWSSSAGTSSSAWSNTALPNTSTPNGLLAPFWDDLYLGTGYDVRVQTTGTAGSQVFVIEWLNATAGSSGSDMTFQIHMIEGTNLIEYHYCTVGTTDRDTGNSATIGLENLTGTAGVTTSYDTAGAVMTGSGFRYTPNP